MGRALDHRLQQALMQLHELHAHRDFGTLPGQIIRTVRTLIPCDIATYNEIDRTRGELRAEHDFPGDAAKHFPAFMAHCHEHPVIAHVAQTGDPEPLRTSDFVSHRVFQRSPVFNEFYRHFGIRFQLSSFLELGLGYQVAVVLQGCRRDFTVEDSEVLRLLIPHLRLAWENCRERVLRHEDHISAAGGLVALGSEEVVLDSAWRIRVLSERAASWLKGAFGVGLVCGQKLPAELAGWLRERTSLDVSKSMLKPADWETLTRRNVQSGAILRIRWQPISPLSSRLMITCYGSLGKSPDLEAVPLTPREREVLHWLVEAKTNPEIGTILGMKPNTVRKHLERIYAKLGVENRAAAMRWFFDANGRLGGKE